MGLNKVTGNMYSFCTHTWNVIKGKCEFDCTYCYMKRFPQKEIRFDEKEFKTDLGKDNFIFVGSSCDMFAPSIPDEWIEKILVYCANFKNKYLFQSKDPCRFYELTFPKDTILGTTIESNRDHNITKAPEILRRIEGMELLAGYGYRTMVTIEPILDFDIDELIRLLKICEPDWVNIGADSQRSNLPEPSAEKIRDLISELGKFTVVKLKKNLNRILNET